VKRYNRLARQLQLALFGAGFVFALLSGDALIVGANAGLSLVLLTMER
jgi:hypothetical protein